MLDGTTPPQTSQLGSVGTAVWRGGPSVLDPGGPPGGSAATGRHGNACRIQAFGRPLPSVDPSNERAREAIIRASATGARPAGQKRALAQGAGTHVNRDHG